MKIVPDVVLLVVFLITFTVATYCKNEAYALLLYGVSAINIVVLLVGRK